MALLISTVGAAAAHAQSRPPWQMPSSDFGGAVPLSRGAWLKIEDYPTEAVRNGVQGYVTVGIDIGAKGRVTACKVTRSSGHALLDSIPCRILKRRARFKPALDTKGIAVATQGTMSMQFWLPN